MNTLSSTEIIKIRQILSKVIASLKFSVVKLIEFRFYVPPDMHL